eukprot:TRINITY_DN8533_c0_g1_i1.p1 TRINITY_DN8533_c0_g1~~TRINITY_DN8533_c0_g1_i1.p1  ORF type:complete len:194 (+),score=23.86 TRINITY_DN8533_c0_g1_i1:31-612(+)
MIMELLHLPQEIFAMHIFPLLELNTIACVLSVCKEWHDLASRNIVWLNLFKKKYDLRIGGAGIITETDVDWKLICRQCTKQLPFIQQIPTPPSHWEPSAKKFVEDLRKNVHADTLFVHIARRATAIFYRYNEITGNWTWSADWEYWMDCSTIEINGGWEANMPAQSNIELIQWLHTYQPRPFILRQQIAVVLR